MKPLIISLLTMALLCGMAKAQSNIVIQVQQSQLDALARSYTNVVATTGYTNTFLAFIRQECASKFTADHINQWIVFDQQQVYVIPLNSKFLEMITNGVAGSNDLFTIRTILGKYP